MADNERMLTEATPVSITENASFDNDHTNDDIAIDLSMRNTGGTHVVSPISTVNNSLTFVSQVSATTDSLHLQNEREGNVPLEHIPVEINPVVQRVESTSINETSLIDEYINVIEDSLLKNAEEQNINAAVHIDENAEKVIKQMGAKDTPSLITQESLVKYREPAIETGSVSEDKTNMTADKSCLNDSKNVHFLVLQGDDDNLEDGVYHVIRGALPLWKIAKKHATLASKCEQRIAHLEKLVADKTPPLWAYGMAACPDYMRPLPPIVLDLMKKHSLEVTNLVIREMNVRFHEDKRIYATYAEMVRSFYEKEDDPDYIKAQTRINELLSTYKEEESKRLVAFDKRERKRYPNGDKELNDALLERGRISEETPAPNPRTRSGSRGRQKKRRRDDSGNKEPRSEQAPVNAPSTSTNAAVAATSNNRYPQQNSYRGRGGSVRPPIQRGRGQSQRGRGSGRNTDQYAPSSGGYRGRGGRGRGAPRGRGRGPARGGSRGAWNREESNLVDAMRQLLHYY